MKCECRRPPTAHRWPKRCLRCGGSLDPEWQSSDETFAEFFDHLACSPDVEAAFVEHCRMREEAGRPVFGQSFHRRNNEREAMEEVADFANYMLFGCLKRRRLGSEEQRAKAMEAARHAAIAWKLAVEIDQEK